MIRANTPKMSDQMQCFLSRKVASNTKYFTDHEFLIIRYPSTGQLAAEVEPYFENPVYFMELLCHY
ncbi:hypothetical protein OLMES_0894 [Oleiphilus messinensis]|uniref:Uncharacterized protein n=1 Tax=Oleiphilus messinensis TaxID=141451 RepID=A0A1Y0I3J0_9GAMM|nr:hypothetical protein OLMES_0894 [Oleiphilus messinensis]